MSNILLAEADHRRAFVVVCSYAGHMADVSVTVCAVGSKSLIKG